MDMTDIRKDIDTLDLQIRELLMQRMDCSRKVAQAKQEAGSTDVYRADREREILDKLGAEVPEDRRAQYLAVVRKVMEASRMYQYGLIFQRNPGLFDQIQGAQLACGPSSQARVRLTRPDAPNAMSAILAMVGDYGFDMERMEQVQADKAAGTVTFDLTIRGDVAQEHMRQLLFQLSKESADFQIMETR